MGSWMTLSSWYCTKNKFSSGQEESFKIKCYLIKKEKNLKCCVFVLIGIISRHNFISFIFHFLFIISLVCSTTYSAQMHVHVLVRGRMNYEEQKSILYYLIVHVSLNLIVLVSHNVFFKIIFTLQVMECVEI